MTQVAYHVAATDDDRIAGPHGELDWLREHEAAHEEFAYGSFLDGIDALVMGRIAYETVRSLGDGWPFGGRPAWVLSRATATPSDAPAGVRFTKEAPRQLAVRWRALGRRRVWLVGGAQAAGAFAAADLIDELIVTRVPVRLGTGPMLFGSAGAVPAALQCASRTRLAHGLVREHWVRSG